MKRVLIVLLVLAIALASFIAGELHVLLGSTISTVDRYDPQDPSASEWNGYDQRILIEIDGQVFEHGMYQG